MISIITSVHNQLGMNKLFFETLAANSSLEFELIIIDNNSTDGTREYFQEKANTLILNQQNYSYPYCQNQGIAKARYDYLAFFNNDLLVSKNWDKRMLEIMDRKQIEIISFATNDHLENRQAQKALNRKWKRIKYPLKAVFGTSYHSLKLMARLTYGNFARFCENRYQQFADSTIEAFSGSAILMKKTALEKVGVWDERIQAADFDLFLRAKERSMTKGDIKPVQMALGVYFHHYQRLTAKAKYPPFADKANIIPLKEKWGDKATELLKDIHSW